MEPAKSAQLALPELPDPEAAPAPELSDAEFVLRTFGVNPAKYMRPCEPGEVAEDGAATYLDRELLAADVDGYRTLFANRVLHGRFV